ncbi:DUF3159 domain-containing protein [Streptacidiphilus jiangxiensis]|uniref:Intracellular septation protein A n=1 Tax=Streptacidiphilus jiangxiensis TaxID=235985 RepID=A0A1H7KU78_STRJI|nr:DUF3159 domain-containing protein [Streptacidiphilus jiangxiensis]SEK90423.1 Protein of unknown function [Streptacidiphilus jiangxiensis]
MSHRAPSADAADAGDNGAASLIEAFGGVRGMIDMTLPGLVFIVVFTITKDVAVSSWSALGLTLVPVAWRLWRRETLKHAFGGVLGVGIGAFIAIESGKPQNFYLTSMIYGLVLLVAYAVSALVRWPLLGVMLGPVLGENMTWRTQNPGRLAAYTKATWVWVALFALRALILFPLYWAGQVTWLGVAKIALGVPPWLVAIYLSWLILSKAPPPIKVNLEDDHETEAPEQQAARAVDDAVEGAFHDLASSPVPQERSER